MRTRLVQACATPLFLIVFAASALANPLVPPLYSTVVADGFSRPVFVTSAPGDASRLFVVEQRGEIRVIEQGTVLDTPFIDLSGVVTQSGNERGLLGLAFDPDYANNGHFYTNYTDSAGHTQIVRYTVSSNPNVASTATAHPVMSFQQPFTNHNGGWIDFGPDGYLYIASGDGGSSNDPGNFAQNTSSLLGKMLRIDVHSDAFPSDPTRNYGVPASNPFVGQVGADEIWAYGLRNPWRSSFDRTTGDLYIADVGQSAREEINFQPAGSSGGENYGWRILEGTLETGLGTPSLDMVPPIYEYGRDQGISVTGGYVYRGTEIEGLNGAYLFGDFGSASIWSLRYDGQSLTEFVDHTADLQPTGGAIQSISSFGEDADGNLYVVSLQGTIYRINGRLLGDANHDGQVDGADYIVWASHFQQPGTFDQGDFNRDGIVDGADYVIWASRFQSSAAVMPVPEPSSWLIALSAAIGLYIFTASRTRRKT